MLNDFSYSQLLVMLAIFLLAYGFRGVTGFGSGLIAIPLVALFIPLPVVVPLVSLLDLIASIMHGVRHREHTRWRHVLPLLPTMLIGITVALYVLKTLDTTILVKTLGIFVLLFALYSLFVPGFKKHASPYWSFPTGFIGGVISTLFGTGGPLYVIYLQLQAVDKSVFRATIASIFIIEGGLRVGGYLLAGLYNQEMLLTIAVGTPVMLFAMHLGGRIHTSISQKQFQQAVGILLLLSGIALLYK